MPFEFIKPGTKIEFIGHARLWITVSLIMILISAGGLATRGLNLGVDFRGGTKLVVAFKGAEPIDREAIRLLVAEKFKSLMPEGTTPLVEVQDFVAKTTEEDVSRYMIYTEAVSLLTEDQKTAIEAAFKAKFGEDVVVNPPAEGGDQFFVTFPDEASIADRTAAMTELFAANGVKRVVMTSDRVRDLNMEFYKEANLASTENTSPEAVLQQIEAEEAFKARVAALEKTGQDSSYTVRIEELKSKIEEALSGAPDLAARFKLVESSTSVSPSVGSDLFDNALLALFYACIAILIYVALRFDFRYGPGAVIALMHDAFITLGILSLTQLPFTLTLVAAVLTIIGYSVNDTIVIFDRIRENMTRLKGLPLDRIANISVNETLSRSILTNCTVMMAVVAIYLFGGGTIQDFGFTMIFGVVVGSYSTIFIATPIVLYLDKLMKKRSAAPAA